MGKSQSKKVINQEQHWHPENLRQEVMKGYEQIKNGQSRRYNSIEQMFDEVTTEAKAEFEARKTR
jgi:hypothetical protein